MSDAATLYISAIHVPADSAFAATAMWDYYQLHRLVCTGFGDRAALDAARVLFRFDVEDDGGLLFVQSRTLPDWSRLPPKLKLSVAGPKPLNLPPLETGTRLRFRLLARPSMRIGNKTSPDYGRRIVLLWEEDQKGWLTHKGKENGFAVESCNLTLRTWHDSKTDHRLPNATPLPLHAVRFDGVLVVTDSPKLCQAVANGIGTQKAYGFGLLSIAPLQGQ